MRIFRIKLATLLIALFALVGGPFLGTASAASDEDVVVCELAYYTGEFASYGPYLTASLTFPIDNVINADPPLGRTWDLISETSVPLARDRLLVRAWNGTVPKFWSAQLTATGPTVRGSRSGCRRTTRR